MEKSRTSTRGRPARLSREEIVSVVKRMLEEDGGGGTLSMRRIADELGSSPMSIYRHVESMDHLIVLVLDELA
ncbi:MAG: TetR/AcrR family transcriptional regulator, partial [Phycisphaerales bacterium]|nr:TetR/AcrR family transcriptional regulator [Phycisphaerales bacterium]